MIKIGSFVKIKLKPMHERVWQDDILQVIGYSPRRPDRFVLDTIPPGKYPQLPLNYSYLADWLEEIKIEDD